MLRRSNYHDTLAEFFPVVETRTDKEKDLRNAGRSPQRYF